MKHHRKIKWFIAGVFILLLIGYFIPWQVGWCGERPVLKFRFQVAEYDAHDYGQTSITDVLFELDVNKMGKYGRIDFYDKIGGVREYFGFRDIKCSITGKLPIKDLQ